MSGDGRPSRCSELADEPVEPLGRPELDRDGDEVDEPGAVIFEALGPDEDARRTGVPGVPALPPSPDKASEGRPKERSDEVREEVSPS